MSPSPTPALSAGTAPLPPLPDLPAQPAAAAPTQGGFLKSILQGTQPVQDGVTMIQQGCKQIVGSGAVPGSEQIAAQIIALANQFVPMAVQQAMGGQGGGQSQGLTPPPGGAPAGPPQAAPPQPGQGQ
jgi:hypothetical protein